MTITDFSALTLHLPLLDSATLSQAWRDALHASTARPVPSAKQIAPPRVHTPPAARDQSCRSRALVRDTVIAGRERPVAKAIAPAAADQYRPRMRGTGRKPGVQTAQNRPPLLKPDKYVVTLPDGERICVLARPVQGRLRVTVLCAPHLQVEIGRALAILAATFAHSAIALDVAPFAGHA